MNAFRKKPTEPTDDELAAEYVDHDGNKHRLNTHLIHQLGLDQDEVDTLKETHITKSEIMSEMADEAKRESVDAAKLRRCAKRIQDIEFEQQALWRFSLNPNYHYWWIIPGCTCPNDENRSHYGKEMVVTTRTCPIHGDDSGISFDEHTGWSWNDD